MSDKNKGPWGQHSPGQSEQPGQEELDRLIRQSQKTIKRLFTPGGSRGSKGRGKSSNNGSGNGGIPGQGFNRYVAMGIIAVLGVIWLATGIYTVDTKEEALVLRFGKYVRTEEPGLKYRLPYPFETVFKLRVTDRYVDDISTTTSASYNQRYAQDSNLLMLTGDENIVDMSFQVQWQIADAEKFVFNVRDPRETVRNAAESAMRQVIATTPIDDILSEDRITAQLQTKILLQEILDTYDAGVVIEEINMKAVPPGSSITVEVLPDVTKLKQGDEIKSKQITTTVEKAFKEVQAAINNKQELINIAKGYANQRIPIARGEAEQILLEAQAYKQEVIARSQGGAQRFSAVYDEYRKAKDVTRKRMYFETMEEVLADIDKVIIDKAVGHNAVPYLPLNELSKR